MKVIKRKVAFLVIRSPRVVVNGMPEMNGKREGAFDNVLPTDSYIFAEEEIVAALKCEKAGKAATLNGMKFEPLKFLRGFEEQILQKNYPLLSHESAIAEFAKELSLAVLEDDDEVANTIACVIAEIGLCREISSKLSDEIDPIWFGIDPQEKGFRFFSLYSSMEPAFARTKYSAVYEKTTGSNFTLEENLYEHSEND